MNTLSKTSTVNDHYCQSCSTSSLISSTKRLSCFSCDHCHVSMCYDCFEKHTSTLTDEYPQLQKRFSKLTTLFDKKRQSLAAFEEHCIRSVDSAFDAILNDLENLRNESINYVKQQFNDAEIIISDMMTNIRPLSLKSQQNWTRDSITKDVMVELETQRKQISDIEHCLATVSSPNMNLKISTFPRNKFDLHCQLLLNSFAPTKNFSSNYLGKIISTRCSCDQPDEFESEKIDVDTEVEELDQNAYTTKQVQTDPLIELDRGICDDDDEFYSVHDETSELNNRINAEHCLSTRYVPQGTIITQNEVDRIASDGEHLLYFSDTSKSLCYVTHISLDRRTNDASITKEITCRWQYHPILDLIYSPISSQFICATKTGIYTCTIDSTNDDLTINIQMQLIQQWSYVRLSVDKTFLWIWTDTPQSSQLSAYSPKTFDCIKLFNLTDYPRFSDNSTSFCIHTNILATVFQFKQTSNMMTYKKHFHVTLCDSTDLHELCTIRLGECDIDHEIRANNDGNFFITNGKQKLWIVDRNGRKEYVKLNHIGRALTIHSRNEIFIANGTQQLQCVAFL